MVAILANQDSGSGFAGIKLGRGDCLRVEVSRILYRLYCEYQFTPRQRRDPLLYWPRALFLICRLLAVGSISTPVVT